MSRHVCAATVNIREQYWKAKASILPPKSGMTAQSLQGFTLKQSVMCRAKTEGLWAASIQSLNGLKARNLKKICFQII